MLRLFIFVIFVIIAGAVLFLFGGQWFGGSATKRVDLNISARAKPAKS